MIFDAKCKSFKIFIIVLLGLVGGTSVTNCQAERNPLSPVSLTEKQDFQALVSDKAIVQFEAFKREREHNQKRWNELKQFVGQQTNAANQKLVSYVLNDWWTGRGLSNKAPMALHKAENAPSTAVAPSTFIIRLAGNMSAIQWWQVSDQLTSFFESTQEHVVENTTRFNTQCQTSLLHFTKTCFSHATLQVNDFASVSSVKRVFPIAIEKMAANPNRVIENVNANETSVDAYWSYYSDCDHWGIEFTPSE